MSQVASWFGRKFEFSFPVELYPNLCVRLRGAPVRLQELVQDCPRALLVRRSQEKWSIQEQAGHLLDLESLWSARVDDFLGESGQLTAADLTNRKTHEAGHNDREVDEIVSEFRKARLKLLDRVQGLGADAFSRAMLHPRLQQPMRLVDHLCFVAEHDDHHLARIWELAEKG